MTRTIPVIRTVALIATLGLAPCSGLPVEKLTFTPGWNLFSPRQDAQLGKESAAQVEKQMPLLNDADTLQYVTQLGKRLAGFAPNNRPEYAWQYKLVNSSDINAFALPGGYIFVNRGAIEAAENEAELAGVIAHESGHVVMRHGTNMVSKQMLWQAPAALATGVLGQNDSLLGQAMQLLIGVGVNSVLLKYSRSAEAQADEVGTYILHASGYDPHAMAQFFQIIEKKYPQRTIQFFSDHPVPENRIKAVDAEIAKLGPPAGAKTDTPEFQAIKAHLAKLAPPPKKPQAPQPGAASPPPAPSEHLVRYDGKTFTLQYPDNWQVQQSEDGLLLYPPNGMVSGESGETDQAYGATVSRLRPQGEGWSLENATQDLLKNMRQANPQLSVVQQTNTNVQGRSAISVLMRNASPLPGEQETDRLVTIRQGDYLLALIFVAPDKAFDSYAPTFDRILQSLETAN